jgi:hypothetical protein
VLPDSGPLTTGTPPRSIANTLGEKTQGVDAGFELDNILDNISALNRVETLSKNRQNPFYNHVSRICPPPGSRGAVDFLVTWNCRHLANAVHQHRIEEVVETQGYRCPVICTPEELMEE